MVVEELPVHHHHRGVVAGCVALDVLQGDAAVGGGLAGVDAKLRFQGLQDLVAAHHRAQGVGADPDQVFPGGGVPVHRVEGGHRGDLGIGQAELGCAEADSGPGEAAVLRLDQVQQWQQRRPGMRIAFDDHTRVSCQACPGLRRIRIRSSDGGAGLIRARTKRDVDTHRSLRLMSTLIGRRRLMSTLIGRRRLMSTLIGRRRPSPGRYSPPRRSHRPPFPLRTSPPPPAGW